MRVLIVRTAETTKAVKARVTRNADNLEVPLILVILAWALLSLADLDEPAPNAPTATPAVSHDGCPPVQQGGAH